MLSANLFILGLKEKMRSSVGRAVEESNRSRVQVSPHLNNLIGAFMVHPPPHHPHHPPTVNAPIRLF